MAPDTLPKEPTMLNRLFTLLPLAAPRTAAVFAALCVSVALASDGRLVAHAETPERSLPSASDRQSEIAAAEAAAEQLAAELAARPPGEGVDSPFVRAGISSTAFELQAGDVLEIPFEWAVDEGASLLVTRVDRRPEAHDPHACVSIWLGENEFPYQDEPPVAVDDTATDAPLTVRVARDCGWMEDARLRAVPLRFVARGADERESGATVLQVSYHLDNPVEVDARVEIDLSDDEVGRVIWRMTHARRNPAHFVATLVAEDAALDAGSCLRVGFVEAGTPPVSRAVFELSEETPSALLEIEARRVSACKQDLVVVPLRVAMVQDESGALGPPQTLALEVTLGSRAGVGPRSLVLLFVAGLLLLLGRRVWRHRKQSEAVKEARGG